MFTTRWVFYDDAFSAAEAEELGVDASTMLPSVDGILNIGHPVACAALSAEAVRSGAVVHRGVTSIDIDSTGERPAVAWTGDDGSGDAVATPILVGADGRASAVRRHYGVELRSAPVRQYMTGLLVEGSRPLTIDIDCYGSGRDVNYYSFPQGPNRSRISSPTSTFTAMPAQAGSTVSSPTSLKRRHLTSPCCPRDAR